LDQGNAIRIFGVYHPGEREVYFFYPRKGDQGQLKGMVLVILPRPQDGIVGPITFLGRLSQPVSAGTDLRLVDRKALVFRSDDQRGYLVEGPDDAGTNFSGFWQSGLEAMPELNPHRVEEMEVFAERGVGFGTLTLRAVTSHLLGNPLGTQGAAVAVALTSEPPTDTKGTDARGTFLGVRHEFTTPITLRWYGTKLVARKVE
jgi:hypothetical protein